jgi:hypothetical protein
MEAQRDLFEARAARDEGLAIVEDHNEPWMDRALREVAALPPYAELTSEDIRFRLVGRGLEEPGHHNAWGALTMNAVRRGLLLDTGQMRAMSGPKSHARRTPVWRRSLAGRS